MRDIVFLIKRNFKSELCFLLLLLSLVPLAAAKPLLKFNNHKFKIVQFTDLHWVNSPECKKQNDSTLCLIKTIAKEENPDLLIFTGDLVVSSKAAESWKYIIQSLNELKIPFAVTFGNHDTEADISKREALNLLQTSYYNLTENDNPAIDGVGNCMLPVKSFDGKVNKWALYLFDSHSYPQDSTLGSYDWIKNSQIQWYRQTSTKLAQKSGTPLPSIAFFHIPLPEYEIVRELQTTIGNKTEQVCSPSYNSGLFTSFIEMKDVLGVFTGHDHNNDYAGSLAKICLAYGRKTGYNSAYKEILERGARVIELDEDGKRFATYIRTLSGKSLYYTLKR
jgi:Predicted phosphohydrolases